MKRHSVALFVIVLAAIGALATAPGASGAHDFPNLGPNFDFTYGEGTTGVCPQPNPDNCPSVGARRFRFAAVSGPGPGPQPARGFWEVDTGVFGVNVLRGRVTCLWVSGNLAGFSGFITDDPGTPANVGQPFQQWVLDGDQTVGSPPDGFSPFNLGVPGCPLSPASPFGYLPVIQGDIVVHDGQQGPCVDDDADDDGLDDFGEFLAGTLTGDADSDDDGTPDGNEDNDDDGTDDEDEDDGSDDCEPDSDGDDTDDEDEDD